MLNLNIMANKLVGENSRYVTLMVLVIMLFTLEVVVVLTLQ